MTVFGLPHAARALLLHLLLAPLALIAAADPVGSTANPAPWVASNEAAMTAYLEAQSNLPVIERSDWINVKTDVTPPAVGDGVADDTAAIQAALAMLEGKDPATVAVYFPPGTYRISASLVVTQVQGGALYGHGRASVIVWDGPAGGRMLHSNGFGRNLYYGLTWDGRGKAAVGVDHDSKGYYETRVRYQYCAFRNFTDSGIRVGHDQKTPSAEMMFYDCLFEDSGRGVSFLAFNDYDNGFARCIFRRCGSGIHCYRGNVYVRDCHFEDSREEDLLLAVHSHSVRRCTSRGSKAFIRGSQPGNYAQQIAVQDCLVSGWSDPAGAVQLSNCGPILIFDSVFESPATEALPAIGLVSPEGSVQTLITANVQVDGVALQATNLLAANRVTDVPRSRPQLIASDAAKRWLARPVLPTRIIDAKVVCGAVGDGKADDTDAIQKAIDLAAMADDGAQAYLPAGIYRITRSLQLGPGRYSLGGPIARRTRVKWDGPAGGVLIAAHNTTGATISQLFLSEKTEGPATAIRVTADQPGAITLDGVFAGGSKQPEYRGTLLDHLPAGFVVTSPHLDGEITIDHCGDAMVLLDYYFTGYDSPLTLRGPTGSGFIGIHSAAGSHNDPDMTVEDSATLVVGDFYTEQTLGSLVASGKPGQPAGRVTVSYAKLATRNPGAVRLEGYSGQVTMSRANLMYRPAINADGEPVKVGEKAASISDAAAVLPVAGGTDTTLLLLANAYKTGAPTVELTNANFIQIGGNVWRMDGERSDVIRVPDSPNADATAKAVNVALDHFRELSRVALGLPPTAQ